MYRDVSLNNVQERSNGDYCVGQNYAERQYVGCNLQRKSLLKVNVVWTAINFSIQVEAQLTDFRNTIKMKEAEIEELKSRAALGGRSSASRGDSYDSELQPHQRQTVSILTQAISERDDQIEDLQEKLAEASRYLIHNVGDQYW